MPLHESDRPRLEELLRLARSGDQTARNELVEILLPFIRAWVIRQRTGDARSEIYQSIVTRVLAKIPSLPDGVQTLWELLGYVRTMVKNRCCKHFNELNRRPDSLHSTDPVDPTSDPEDDWDSRIIQILTALHLLPPREREVLELNYLRGMSSREIGEVMGLLEKTVNVLKFRAKRHVQKLLGLPEDGRCSSTSRSCKGGN